MGIQNSSNITVNEYIQIERETDQKYEFHNGTIYALAGGTLNHGWICGNIFGELRSGLKSKGDKCKAMTSEIKLYIAAGSCYVYPDAMVVCGEVETNEKEIQSVTNPQIIIEVLSPSTEIYDRGDKFYLYRQVKSLKEYVLIDQSKPQIEIFKKEGDLWQITRITGLEKSIHLSSIDLEISLTEIYNDIVWNTE